jgi:hypothetical protein
MELLNRDEVIESLNAEINFSIESDYDLTKIKSEFQKFADEIVKAQEKAINELEPVTDAVHVVRCKNCKHWEPTDGIVGICKEQVIMHSYDSGVFHLYPEHEDNYYCAYGEEKDE